MRRKKILVVDDEPHIVNLIKMSLEEKYDVIFAYTAREAMGMVKREEPDVILLDIMMPGENGYDFCSRIRQSKKHKKTPVIFISARSQIEDKMHSMEAGGDDYITKPFDPVELEKKIESNLIMSKVV